MSNESALIPTEQKTVLFYDDEIMAVQMEGGSIFVPVRQLCDYLGVDWSAQYRRLSRDPVLGEVQATVAVTATDGRMREQVCLPLDYLNGWLFGVNADRVKPEIRERLIRYQKECYRVLARAFVKESSTTDAATPAMAALVQVREMGMAIVRLAEEQMEFERRLVTRESRLERAAVVYGDLTRRVTTLEQKLAPSAAVSEDQASQLSQGVKAVALALGQQTSRNEFGAVYGELYRKFGVTSYKQLPRGRFDEAMRFLNEWYQTITGEGLPF